MGREVNESTSQQVNKSTSFLSDESDRSDKSDRSDGATGRKFEISKIRKFEGGAVVGCCGWG